MEKGGFVQARERIGLSAPTVVGYADEMRLGLRGTTRRVWGRRGVKVRQCRQLTDQWRYLFLVVDPREGRLFWCWLPSLHILQIWGAVAGLRATPIEALVWDGATTHRDRDVREVGVPLITLPPYSPELNPAERVFEELRRWTEGVVYPTIEDKVAAVEKLLWEMDADPARVRSLTDWWWIQSAHRQLLPQIAA